MIGIKENADEATIRKALKELDSQRFRKIEDTERDHDLKVEHLVLAKENTLAGLFSEGSVEVEAWKVSWKAYSWSTGREFDMGAMIVDVIRGWNQGGEGSGERTRCLFDMPRDDGELEAIGLLCLRGNLPSKRLWEEL